VVYDYSLYFKDFFTVLQLYLIQKIYNKNNIDSLETAKVQSRATSDVLFLNTSTNRCRRHPDSVMSSCCRRILDFKQMKMRNPVERRLAQGRVQHGLGASSRESKVQLSSATSNLSVI